ncbi:MAG: nuclear transport factor 2 family protein [Acidimicrobiia bacterium]|nr:nuclear transport factor 2 family protein [Acidimicrobiia bacterium]
MASAVEGRDAAAVASMFCEDGTFQNVPYAEVRGRTAIESLFAPILGSSERVEWELVSVAVSESRLHYERMDRFWIRGEIYAVECHAVIEVDTERGLIRTWRDYVDLGRWRATLGGVLDSI